MQDFGQRLPIASAPLSVILLARNEGSDVEEVITIWVHFLDGLQREYEILLVDDGSTDGTGTLADSLAQRHPRLVVFHHETPQGLGACLRTALAAAHHPLVAYTLTNKQFQPTDLTRMLEAIDKVDLVAGFRVWRPIPFWLASLDLFYRFLVRILFGLRPEPRTAWPGWPGFWRRRFGRWLFGVRVQDPECPFCLYRRKIFARIPIQSNGAFAQMEILAKANFLGCWMIDVPVTCLPQRGKKEAWVTESGKHYLQERFHIFCHPEFGPPVLLPSTPESPPAQNQNPHPLAE